MKMIRTYKSDYVFSKNMLGFTGKNILGSSLLEITAELQHSGFLEKNLSTEVLLVKILDNFNEEL